MQSKEMQVGAACFFVGMVLALIAMVFGPLGVDGLSIVCGVAASVCGLLGLIFVLRRL